MLEIKRTRMHCNAHRFQNFSRVSSLYLPCPLEWLTHFEFRTCPYTASFVATQWCSRLYDFLLLNYFVLKNSCSSETPGFLCFQIHPVANYLPFILIINCKKMIICTRLVSFAFIGHTSFQGHVVSHYMDANKHYSTLFSR